MQRLLHTGIAALALLAASASAQTVRTVVQNGPSEDLYDMVILGDGYTAAEQGQFDQDVVDVIDYFRNTPNKFPYGAYFDLYNVHTVFRASNQSGADKPPLNIFVDTAYDASYWTGGTERCLYIGNGGQAMADAALAPDTDGRVIVLVNDPKYGGCAGAFSVSYNGTSMEDVQAHEWGHSFGGLADEYDYGRSGTYTGSEPGSPNITADPTGSVKWAPWLGVSGPQGVVGAYQGAGYYATGLYRPEPDCEMRSLNRNFCTVCREQFIKRFHQECVVIGSPTPGPIAAPRGGTAQVSFTNRIAGRPHTIEWRVDGGTWQLTNQPSFTWNVGPAPAGRHTIDVRLIDTSAAVRQDPSNLLTETFTWAVDITASDTDTGVSTVLPAVAATAEGGQNSTYPFGVTSGHRAMLAYGGGVTAQGDRPLHVAAVRFRPDGGTASMPQATFDLSLDVSTSRNPATNLDRAFDRNHGGDRVRVHDGLISTFGEPLSGSPRPFLIEVPFDEPFAWNPRSGPLLFDLRMRSSTGGVVLTDAVTDTAGQLGRLLNTVDPNGATANFPASGTQALGLVAELVIAPLVSPSDLARTEGFNSTALGLGYAAAQRVMEIHDGATFGDGGRRLVSALAWRPDAGRTLAGNRTFDIRVELSTGAPSLSQSASSQFDVNHGADRTVVFDGPWTPPAGSSGQARPAGFLATLDLERPFEFDPARGSLVVDIVIRNVSGGGFPALDMGAQGAGTRMLWALGSPAPSNALVNQAAAPVLALISVPHPVLPETADGTPGGISLSRPFGVAGPTRAMTAYAPATIGVTDPVEITHLSWRAAGGTGGATTWDARVDLSSGGALPLGQTFDLNHGPDRTTVFDGRFSAVRAATGEFVVEVLLDTPFRWDPGQGPLCVDVRERAVLGGPGYSLDAVQGGTDLSFAAHTSDADAAVADRPVAARGHVLRLGGTVGANGLVTPYGSGCGTPIQAGSIGLPWLGNLGFRLAIFDAPANAAATVLFGLNRANTPLDPLGFAGCTLLTDAVLGDLGVGVDAQGTGSTAVALPSGATSLLGVRATSQWIVLDPNGVQGVSLSDAVEVEIR
ncbi:MAG: M64 family metallo-endopeptidase [Planctomycetota bacterium]|nr:M64 family metallo-endopeptidase [Planctomycetota bacterium]